MIGAARSVMNTKRLSISSRLSLRAGRPAAGLEGRQGGVGFDSVHKQPDRAPA
jgi:hypothetical protein